ncbi:hypothetical protein Bbelb_345630 [Branchiostoma belcheri]|nr:hypothetical protein Bbelb_438330 [Branchiostoma belcheri]KAI8487570.1 hypothetical protein Bbelb_345630 [Branchiostoma belcheri]
MKRTSPSQRFRMLARRTPGLRDSGRGIPRHAPVAPAPERPSGLDSAEAWLIDSVVGKSLFGNVTSQNVTSVKTHLPSGVLRDKQHTSHVLYIIMIIRCDWLLTKRRENRPVGDTDTKAYRDERSTLLSTLKAKGRLGHP